MCVSEIGKEKNDADVEEEVATGDSGPLLPGNFSLGDSSSDLSVPPLLSRHVGS